MSGNNLTLHCDSISQHAVRCNRYVQLDVTDVDKTVRELIEKSEWTYDNGNTYCEEHS